MITGNARGAVIIFVTILIVLLLMMVGMGLDTGWLAYIRSQGQPAVDAAALSAASGLIDGKDEVESRVIAFNATNDYAYRDTQGNFIGPSNVTPILYKSDGTYETRDYEAEPPPNGVRVALEPETGSAIDAGLFLTPLMNLFGLDAPRSADVSVSAIAVLKNRPELPLALLGCPPEPACTETSTGGCCTDIGGGKYSCVLQVDQQNDTDDNSAFTSFTYSSANAKTFKDMINNTTCDQIPTVDLNQCIYLNNGQVTSAIQEMINVYGEHPDRCFLIPGIDAVRPVQCKEVTSFVNLCFTDHNGDGKSIYKPGSKPGTTYPEGPAIMETEITCGADVYAVNRCSVPVLVRDKASGM